MATSRSTMAATVRPQGASGDVVEVDIYDDIGKDWWTGEGITPKTIRDALAGTHPKKILLRINSGGGDVFDGVAIHNLLRQYAEKGATIEADIDGLAASAASIIAVAADTIRIPANAAVMIHEAWSLVRGTADEFVKRAALLQQINTTAAGTYERASAKRGINKSAAEFLELMADETWLFGEEAVAAGLADSVTDALQVAASIDLSGYRRAAEMRQRLPATQQTNAPAVGAKEKQMSDTALQAELDAVKAAKEQADTETANALELAQKAEAEALEMKLRLDALEEEKRLVEARVADLGAAENRRAVESLVGLKIYPVEVEALVQPRAGHPELVDALLESRPALSLLTDVIPADKPQNALMTDPDSDLAAAVREAEKDE